LTARTRRGAPHLAAISTSGEAAHGLNASWKCRAVLDFQATDQNQPSPCLSALARSSERTKRLLVRPSAATRLWATTLPVRPLPHCEIRVASARGGEQARSQKWFRRPLPYPQQKRRRTTWPKGCQCRRDNARVSDLQTLLLVGFLSSVQELFEQC